MKKIKLQLTFDELDCFATVLAQYGGNYECTDLVRATLLQLYSRITPRVQFRFPKKRTLQLTMPECIAFCAAVGKLTLDKLDSFSLAVIAPIYQTIQQQLQ